MARIDETYLEHQRKRFTRHNWHLYVRHDWRRFMPPGFEGDDPFTLHEHKYSADQPRVPAGSPDGGQWTADGGDSGSGRSSSSGGSEPTAGSGRSDPRVLSDATPDNLYKPGARLAQVADDARPLYDKADAALLAPKGVNADASSQKLEYRLDDDGVYRAGITVVNEDRTAVGRMIYAINGTPTA